MDISLEEWLEIDRAARASLAAQVALAKQLEETILAHLNDPDVVEFINTIEDRMIDGIHIARSLRLQSEWLGGDSSEAENHGLREPNTLGIVRHIPHLIPGSRGLSTS